VPPAPSPPPLTTAAHHRHHVSSCLQALGFTESDSAGQSNVFAVEPKSYVAGSSADATSEGAKVTFVVGLAAAVVAFAACAAFLLADTKPSSERRICPPACVPACLPAWLAASLQACKGFPPRRCGSISLLPHRCCMPLPPAAVCPSPPHSPC
jgi:hypothetical protein